MEPHVKTTVTIEGRKEHVIKLVRLLDAIDLCGDSCTRKFTIFYDGDGAARLKIRNENGDYLVERNKESWDVLDGKLEFDFE